MVTKSQREKGTTLAGLAALTSRCEVVSQVYSDLSKSYVLVTDAVSAIQEGKVQRELLVRITKARCNTPDGKLATGMHSDLDQAAGTALRKKNYPTESTE